MVLGATLNFTASVQTSTGGIVRTPATFTSSDTSILTLAPNGVACAGQFNLNYTVCTPGATGPVTVTATALGASSIPTYVFVHAPIDNIIVTGVLLTGLPVQEPCLSKGQSMTVEAHAFSQGTDITSSVGPFTWSANNPSVVSLVPLVNEAYNFATNQATANAGSPGFTEIYASASGVTSLSFLQPQFQNSQGATSPPLDFFETCPILSIALEVGAPGTQQTGQTTFVTSKGTAQNADRGPDRRDGQQLFAQYEWSGRPKRNSVDLERIPARCIVDGHRMHEFLHPLNTVARIRIRNCILLPTELQRRIPARSSVAFFAFGRGLMHELFSGAGPPGL